MIFFETLGAGEPLLFLNGIMMTTGSWALQTRALSKRFRCILCDFRGQLRSPRSGPLGLDHHVADVLELLDHLGLERVSIVGTSFGGEIGMAFAARYPERVSRLIVIACVAHVGEELRRLVQRWSDTARTDPEQLYDVSAAHNFSPRFLEDHPEVVIAGKERLRSHPPDFFLAFADLCDEFLTLDIRDELPKITAPTLVIAAERDALKPPPYSEEIVSLIPNATLHVIPDAGHAVVIEDARAVNEAIAEFLAVSS
jgi:3-oxoadipate enol-lactonase